MTDMGLQGLESNEMPVCKICGNERPRKHSLGRCLPCFKRELRKRHRMMDRRCLGCRALFVTAKATELFCSSACRLRGAR